MISAIFTAANKGAHDACCEAPASPPLSRWRAQVAKSPSRLSEQAIDLFAENPFWTVNKLAQRLDVAFTTAQRAIDRLESARIVARVGKAKRNQVYCAREILKILEEPPQSVISHLTISRSTK